MLSEIIRTKIYNQINSLNPFSVTFQSTVDYDNVKIIRQGEYTEEITYPTVVLDWGRSYPAPNNVANVDMPPLQVETKMGISNENSADKYITLDSSNTFLEITITPTETPISKIEIYTGNFIQSTTAYLKTQIYDHNKTLLGEYLTYYYSINDGWTIIWYNGDFPALIYNDLTIKITLCRYGSNDSVKIYRDILEEELIRVYYKAETELIGRIEHQDLNIRVYAIDDDRSQGIYLKGYMIAEQLCNKIRADAYNWSSLDDNLAVAEIGNYNLSKDLFEGHTIINWCQVTITFRYPWGYYKTQDDPTLKSVTLGDILII